MDFLWFGIGLFVGGTMGGLLMAAASVANRSDYFGPEQLLAGAYEGIDVPAQAIDDEKCNQHYDHRNGSVQNSGDGSHPYFLVSREG